MVLLTVAEFGSGVGVMVLDVGLGSLQAAVIPDQLRSRVWGAILFVNWGVRPIGALGGGLLAGSIGLAADDVDRRGRRHRRRPLAAALADVGGARRLRRGPLATVAAPASRVGARPRRPAVPVEAWPARRVAHRVARVGGDVTTSARELAQWKRGCNRRHPVRGADPAGGGPRGGPRRHGHPPPLPARDRAGRLGRAAGGVLRPLLHPQVRRSSSASIPSRWSTSTGGSGGRRAPPGRRPRPSRGPPRGGPRRSAAAADARRSTPGSAPAAVAGGDRRRDRAARLGRRRIGRRQGSDRRRIREGAQGGKGGNGGGARRRAAASRAAGKNAAGGASSGTRRRGRRARSRWRSNRPPKSGPASSTRRASRWSTALTLAAGETVGPFHSRSYTAAFGNGSVDVMVDGKRARDPRRPRARWASPSTPKARSTNSRKANARAANRAPLRLRQLFLVGL